MMHRFLALAVGLAVLSSSGAFAQQKSTASTYKVPRTPDGQPDLQGFWTNLTYTPFERPKALADKPLYTEQEAIDAFNKAVAGSQNEIVHYTNSDFGATPVQSGAKPSRRTSLIIDPADGRMPPLTPDARTRQEARLAAQRAAGPLARTWRDDRGGVWCVFHDRLVPAVVAPYGSNFHIVQSRDFVVITYEWNTERRIIPLDGRPHADPAIRSYVGDARGHWEGETLVVETTNFTSKRIFPGAPGTPPGAEMLPTFRLVERFTRVAGDAIVQTYTVNDPQTWTRPWTVEIPMHSIKGPMLEYACNENNQDMFSTLKNARLEEEGKIPPADPARRGDAKAAITEREEKGETEVVGGQGTAK